MLGDNMMFWSLIMAAIFVFGGVQVRSGKTDFLGKDMDKDIRPELKKAYCREMSIPMFVLAAVELIDVILQLTIDFTQWSLLILGTGILVGIGWIVMIQRKYSKM